METLANLKNKTLPTSHSKRSLTYDIKYKEDGNPKPVIIFIHGFKGFKDWGTFPQMAEYFAENGFIFVKFNFSHNGTTPEYPDQFVDPEAFGNNNFSKEMDDIGVLIDHLHDPSNEIPTEELDLKRLFLIGHSRGGSIAILKGYEDNRVKGIATMAAVSDFESQWDEETLHQWEKEGVRYVTNARTGQEMPLYYQLAEDYFQNKSRFNIPEIIKELGKPMIAIHGTEDETVPMAMVNQLRSWNPGIEMKLIEQANHTFGAYHPYDDNILPNQFRKVCDKIIKFFKKIE